jgi:carbamoyltransferase
MTTKILGISAYYHDSAACILIDGKIAAAAQQERFSRKKHDPSFPREAVKFVLDDAGTRIEELTAIAFYDKPYLKFERLLETYLAFAPQGLKSFLVAIPVWIKEKLFMRDLLWKELEEVKGGKLTQKPPLLFPEHHLSHAASAFYPSPFDQAAILTIDGVGEWATTTIGFGENNRITILKELSFPHSLGLLYSAFTYWCGFKVNRGEYKLMGLAPYGREEEGDVKKYKKLILEKLVDLREDGSFLLNLEYFDYTTGLRMCKDEKWEELFGLPPRQPESEIGGGYMDLALAIQQVTEEIVLRLAKTAQKLTGSKNLVMAGGVGLNCVANGKILRSGMFDNLWIQPAAGDAGGALGAAMAAFHIWKSEERQLIKSSETRDAMQGAYLGPEFTKTEIKRLSRKFQAPYREYEDFNKLCQDIASYLAKGKIIGWFQGRMEWGPRALGNRSILADARQSEMQKRLNLKIKYREGFRPFAPSVLEEDTEEYFELRCSSPYMLLVSPVQKKRQKPLPKDYEKFELYERLYYLRSDIPAVTHIDYSARIQTVEQETNPRYYQLLKAFKEQTGCGVLVNTSFNVRGEPIVCTPEEAYRCFMRTELDYLVIENFLFEKTAQPKWEDKEAWEKIYELD